MSLSLVSYEESVLHLRVDADDDAADISYKIEQATDIVLDYITVEEKDTWTVLDVPPLVRAAILLVLGDLYENREGNSNNDGFLSLPVKNLLRRYRTPSMA